MSEWKQCPGCGRAAACTCTSESIRAQLEKDRAELSDRAASYMKRANEAARLIKILHQLAVSGGSVAIADCDRLREHCEQWLGGKQT